MTRKVLCVGNCDPDHNRLSTVLREQFQAEPVRANDEAAAFRALADEKIDLILVNRELFYDGASGIALIQKIRTSESAPATMLISNFADAQDEAVRAGAVPGFGKANMTSEVSLARLAEFLAPAADVREKSA